MNLKGNSPERELLVFESSLIEIRQPLQGKPIRVKTFNCERRISEAFSVI